MYLPIRPISFVPTSPGCISDESVSPFNKKQAQASHSLPKQLTYDPSLSEGGGPN
jgi:hypothetical protein